MNLEQDFPLLFHQAASDKDKGQKHKSSRERKRLRVTNLPNGFKATHAKSKCRAPSLQLPDPHQRRLQHKGVQMTEARTASLRKGLESNNHMLVHKNIIARGAVLGLLKESLTDPSFCLQVIREDEEGVVFAVNHIGRLVVVVSTAFDELCINPEGRGQAMEKILAFLDLRMNSCLEKAGKCTEWDGLKRQLKIANVLPMNIVEVRKNQAASNKISEVRIILLPN